MIKQIYEIMQFYKSKSSAWTPAERETIEADLLPKVIEKGMRDFLGQTSGQP